MRRGHARRRPRARERGATDRAVQGFLQPATRCDGAAPADKTPGSLNADGQSAADVHRSRHDAITRPTSFGKDTGLQLRMTFTMFLLGLVYVVLIVRAARARA